MRVAAIQLELRDDESYEARLARVCALVQRAAGVQLVLLPEMWTVGYFSFDQYAAGAEQLEERTVPALAAEARRLGAYVLTGSFAERDEERLYNTSVLLDPRGRIVTRYRKIHLFGYDSAETRLLTPGTDLAVADTELGRVGITTCYDLRFPELYRRMAERGAELFLIASAWPYPRLEHWLLLTQVRALENLVFLAAANCAGVNRGSRLVGHSRVVDPWGIAVAQAGDDEAIVQTDVDLQAVERTRAAFPAWRDRVASLQAPVLA
jgi:predicted amidohydrolase